MKGIPGYLTVESGVVEAFGAIAACRKSVLDEKLILMALCVFFLLFKKQGIYNIGKEPGLFSMRVVGIKRATPAP